MVIETLKLSGLFILVFIVMRMLGKTLLSQWTAYDLVTIIFLSYAALGAVNVQGFFHAVICIILIGVFYMALSKLSLCGALTHIIIGEPTILIKNGEIIQTNLKQLRYSITELLSTIRSFGYPDIQDIKYAILEPNGQISVISKGNLRPLTPKDLNISPEYTEFPITVIAEGRMKHKNLSYINKTEEWLISELEHKGYQDLRTIFYAYVKGDNDSLIIFPYE
ncbi:hypothetical protein CR203_16975 [Salipaludibacillus neizhouensis]|uniref:YetF C-terminal domain-containing protein n=1 Tax=Salipaludibacillus neizhouensis TaxID=885475 RepID=A0A3A9K6V7_9BACI|nr:DUF421 domain-containing protein [Salipaludibacillus neizhouensis]RKL66242.1 hypothetical protein CR203_16975 [Salipaludibacillus neizhouensis]